MNKRTIGSEELRAFMDQYKLTGSRVAKLTGVSGRTVRRWLDHKKNQTIPWAGWQWMRAALGVPEQVDRVRETAELCRRMESGEIGLSEYWEELMSTVDAMTDEETERMARESTDALDKRSSPQGDD